MEVFENIKGIICRMTKGKYTVKLEDMKGDIKKVSVEKARNFEFRMEKPVKVERCYFGEEYSISFRKPYKIMIEGPDARCYIYVL